MIYFGTWLATVHVQFGQAGYTGSSHLPWLGPAFLVMIPAIGGLVCWPLINRYAREARGHGAPEVMLACRPAAIPDRHRTASPDHGKPAGAAPASADQQERLTCSVLAFLARARPWLAPAAVVLSLGAGLPPSATYARQYEAAQALQFVIFAVVAPALLVLSGARLGGPASSRGHEGSRDLARRRGRRPAVRRPAGRAAAARLLAFIALVIIWRLPAVLNALAADPVLTAAELVTLAGAGSGVWLELVRPALRREALARPLRAAIAAAAMWTIWIIAYVTGMSHLSWTGTHRGTPGALSAAADQQIAVGIMWAVPAICFLPVIYGMLITWLGEREDPGQQHAVPPPAAAQPGLSSGPPRPPRGWRSPSP